MKAKMNTKARNRLLDIIEEKGIEIRELEIEIEEAYKNYYEGEEDKRELLSKAVDHETRLGVKEYKRQKGLLAQLDYGDWAT